MVKPESNWHDIIGTKEMRTQVSPIGVGGCARFAAPAKEIPMAKDPKDHEAKDARERPQPMAIDSAPFAELAPEQQAAAITPSEWEPDFNDSIPIECPYWEVNGLMGHNTTRRDWSIYTQYHN
jgi:hypothetical protein